MELFLLSSMLFGSVISYEIQLENFELINSLGHNGGTCLFYSADFVDEPDSADETGAPVSKMIGDFTMEHNQRITVMTMIPNEKENYIQDFRPFCNGELNEASLGRLCSFKYNCTTEVAITVYEDQKLSGHSQSFSWNANESCYSVDCVNPNFSSAKVVTSEPGVCACFHEGLDCTGRTACWGGEGAPSPPDNFDTNKPFPTNSISVRSENCVEGIHEATEVLPEDIGCDV